MTEPFIEHKTSLSNKLMNGLLNRILGFNSDSRAILVDSKQSLTPIEISRAIARCRYLIHQEHPGKRLAIVGGSSVDFFIWLLAAWFEGKSAIPIDRSFPAERRSFLLKYADAGEVSNLPVRGEARNAPPHDWDDTDEVIVLFTSGTTDQPTGWSIHAGILLADQTLNQIPLMNVLHWSSISHSQSSYHVVSLSHGKRVTCVANDAWMDNQKMLEIIRKWDAELVFCTPSYASIIAQNDEPWLKEVKTYLYGEVANLDLVKSLNATNLYGQTEGPGAWMAIQTPQGDWTPEPDYKLSIYECNSDLEVNDTGVMGHLVAKSGKWLASKQIDSLSPIALPFDTGDLAAWTSLDPPRFQLLGRSNRTCKIRGFRVDLAEIEAKLTSIGSDAATVLLKDDKLVAYVTPDELDVGRLRTTLAKSLPHYMIPSVIQPVSAHPLMTNGKVDTSSLPEIKIQTDYVAPITQAESTMCDLWQEILDVERVGTHDDWHSLGGNSLTAMLLAQQTGYTIPTILTNPTVKKLLAVKASAEPIKHDPNGRIPWISDFSLNRNSSQRPTLHPYVIRTVMRMARCGINLFKGLIITTEPFDLEPVNQTEFTPREWVRILLETHPILTASMHQNADTLQLGIYGVDDVIVSPKEKPRRIVYDLIKNIYSGPLFKIRIDKTTAGKPQAIFWLHHHIGDQQSIGILQRDLRRIVSHEPLKRTPTAIYRRLKNIASPMLDDAKTPLLSVRRRIIDPVVMRKIYPTRDRQGRTQLEVLADLLRELTNATSGDFYLTVDLRFLSGHPEAANAVGFLAAGIVRASLSPSGISYKLFCVTPKQTSLHRFILVNLRLTQTDPPLVHRKSRTISFLPGHLDIEMGPSRFNATWSE